LVLQPEIADCVRQAGIVDVARRPGKTAADHAKPSAGLEREKRESDIWVNAPRWQRNFHRSLK